ncbi:MAG: RdgB/HAM1 family non-canonical purine NTP pyrophosphatase [Dehalococcoidia bacterium]|nr:RdgB/HAM1 family non-canonical purine NTP pyrophosphatase [Dehalococcoidia bacterium]
MIRKILFASSNEHKLDEMRNLFSSSSWQIISPKEIGIRPLNVLEFGSSYAQNAIAKIEAYQQYTHLPILADDSGIEVKALNGKPGIYSARFGGQFIKNDTQRNEYLLRLLDEVVFYNRTAIFKAVLAIRFHDSETIIREGNVLGHIALESRGMNGFGYDPIFELNNGQTMAELGSQKQEISHRALAVKALLDVL